MMIKHTALYQNFPNPFNPETWFPYHPATDADVTLRIYNMNGALVRQLSLGGRAVGSYLTRENAA
jgi:hypothetical protein